MSEDNLYKIITKYKQVTGEKIGEKIVLDNIAEFFKSNETKIESYAGDIISNVEKLNNDFLLKIVPAKSNVNTGYRKTTFFGMEDWKTCPANPGPINAILGKRNANYIRHNTVKSGTANVAKLELDVRRLETGNMTKKITPWQEQYLKVKSESKNYKNNQPNLHEEYNYELF
jgi:spore germination protein GerM